MGINRDKVLASAIKLLQGGKFEKAIAEFQKLVEDDPKDVRTILKIGDTYVKMGRRAEAIASYERVATIYSDQGFYLKAVAVYKQMLRVDGNLPEVHLKLAELYQQLGLTSDCLQHYQQVAVFYEQQGRGNDTLQILKRMVDLDPDNLPSRIKLAELFAQQGHNDDAIAEFRSAATYLRQQERFDDYVRVAERLIYFDPTALDVTRELSQLYLKRGEPKAALGKLQLCFKADPRNLETLALIGQAFLEMQQVPKTISVYKEMARIHEANGQIEEARAQWNRVLGLDPGDAEANEALHGPVPAAAGLPGAGALPGAEGLPGAGALPGAAPAPAPAFVAPAAPAAPPPSPEDEQLARLLTETDVYVKYGLREKAVEHLQKVFALRPDHIEAHEKLRLIHQAMGNRVALVDVLGRLVRLGEAASDPRVASWAADLSALGGAAAPAAAPVAPAAEPVDEEIVLLEESDDILLDPSVPDEPPVVGGGGGSSLPPDEALGEDFPDDAMIGEAADELLLDAGDEELILAEPEDDGGEAFEPDDEFAEPTVGLARSEAPAQVRFEGDISDEALSLEQADALVRQALAGIEGLEDGFDDVVAQPATASVPDDVALDALPSASAEEILDDAPRARPPPIDDPLLDEGEAVAAELALQGTSFDGGGDDELAWPGDDASDEPDASTEIMSLSPAEMDEIREFLGSAGKPTAADLDPRAFSSDGSTAPSLEDVGAGDDDFNDATVAMMAPDIAMGAAPAGRSSPSLAAQSPDLLEDDVDLDAVAAAAAQAALEADDEPPLAPAAPELVPEGVRELEPLAAAPPPSPFDAVPDADDELPRGEPTGVRKAGKLGLADRAIGFENDPASDFFPDELEEAEFFIQQEILDEAKEILESILEDIPDSERVKWMLARIEAKENDEPEPPAPWEQRIIDEVAEEIGDLHLEELVPEETQQISVEEVLSQFKKGVAETVRDDDAETHYNLGIAYREMGLYQDAVAEFRLAARAPSKEVDSHHLIGLTLADLGKHEEALEAFEAALGSAHGTPKQRGANEYQRGVCLEALARTSEALSAFEAAQKLGADMGDLGPRLAKLRAAGGGAPPAGLGSGEDSPHRRKNIDYV